MSAPRKIWVETWVREKGDVGITLEASPYEGSTAYHHDDVVRELAFSMEHAIKHAEKNGMGEWLVFRRMRAALALTKIAQEG